MAHSLIGADRKTHLKILVVALVAGIAFVMVGVAANVSDFETTANMMQDRPVVQAGKPAAVSTRFDVTIR